MPTKEENVRMFTDAMAYAAARGHALVKKMDRDSEDKAEFVLRYACLVAHFRASLRTMPKGFMDLVDTAEGVCVDAVERKKKEEAKL